MKPAWRCGQVLTVRHGRAGRRQAAAWQQPGRARHHTVRHRPQEPPVQRHATRRRGGRRHVIDRGRSQGKRPEPAQVRVVAARGDAQREGPGQPGLPRLANAVVEIRARRHKAEAGGGRGGHQNSRRPNHRHKPLGLPRQRGIAETSRSSLDRNGKTPRGLSFYRSRSTHSSKVMESRLRRVCQ